MADVAITIIQFSRWTSRSVNNSSQRPDLRIFEHMPLEVFQADLLNHWGSSGRAEPEVNEFSHHFAQILTKNVSQNAWSQFQGTPSSRWKNALRECQHVAKSRVEGGGSSMIFDIHIYTQKSEIRTCRTIAYTSRFSISKPNCVLIISTIPMCVIKYMTLRVESPPGKSKVTLCMSV